MNASQSITASTDDVMNANQSIAPSTDDVMINDQSDCSTSDVNKSDQSQNLNMETNDESIEFESKCNIDDSATASVILGASSLDDDISAQIDALIERLSISNAHFKHQQRDDPDLTIEQKSHIARTLFHQHPVKFLSQFSKYLITSDIPCFKHVRDDPTVLTYLNELEKSSRISDKQRVMNRRYEAMKVKTEEGDYFSEDSMKHRDPFLHQQMIGQYLPAEERQPPEIDRADHRFSTILLEFMDRCDDNKLLEVQKEKENEQEEETDSEEEDDDDGTEVSEAVAAPVPTVSDAEKAMLREEFLHLMQERFMAGQDHDFDYKTVDDNSDYDALDIREQDEEEKYFDEMEPESASDCGNLDSDSDCWVKPTQNVEMK